ncbi:MAG TPA: hypothetical protein VMV90_15375 [Rectinemataceae bacterium]|nr:hypothetical protein [Rectinemataceae bacterium]
MSESEELRVLFVQYDRVHFLLNRTQCASSLFASEVQEVGSRHRYLHELLRVGGRRLLFFDLQLFLRETFRARGSAGAQLAVIGELSGFERRTRELFRSSVFPRLGRLELDTERIAFRIPSNTVMKSLKPDELEPHNLSIRRPLAARGVLAVHPTEESMGFLLDLDLLVGSRLLFAGAGRKEESE